MGKGCLHRWYVSGFFALSVKPEEGEGEMQLYSNQFIIVFAMICFIVLVSIQYTLNKIYVLLKEIRDKQRNDTLK